MTGEKSSEVCTVPHRLVRVCDVCGCMRATVHVEDRGQFYGVSSVVLPHLRSRDSTQGLRFVR